jgi:hypothetical protein
LSKPVLALISCIANEESIFRFSINESGYTMNVTVQQDRTSYSLIYKACLDFFLDNVNVDVSTVSNDILLRLLKKYEEALVAAKEKMQPSRSSTHSNNQPFDKPDGVEVSRDTTEIKGLKNIVDFFKEPRSITAYTVNQFNGEIIARTTVELDADIITVLPLNILENNNLAILLSLHGYNILLVNKLFEAQIKHFFADLVVITNVIRGVSLVPSAVSVISFLLSSVHGLSHGSILPAVITTMSPLFYKYAPKIIFRYLPNFAFRFVPRIVGHFMKHKLI